MPLSRASPVPPHVEVLLPGPGPSRLALLHIALDGGLPESLVGGIDRKFRCGRGYLDTFARQDELAQIRVQGERVHAGPD